MKKLIVLFSCITLAAQAADEFRTLTANDGRTLQARVLSYDVDTDVAEILREDGQVVRVNSSAFSDEDQAYVKQWGPCSSFMSKSKLVIIPRRTVDRNWRTGEQIARDHSEHDSELEMRGVDKLTTYQYELSISNRTGFPLENLSMEYVIYYAHERPESRLTTVPDRTTLLKNSKASVALSEMKVMKGIIPVGRLDVSGWKHYVTEPATIVERSTGSQSGIQVRITMDTPDGHQVERTLSLPGGQEQKLLWSVENDRHVADSHSVSDRRKS